MDGWRTMRGDSGVRISQNGNGALSEKIIHMTATGLSIFSQTVSQFIFTMVVQHMLSSCVSVMFVCPTVHHKPLPVLYQNG